MIRSRKTISKPPASPRTIYDILRHPRTDAEEHQADEHIRRERDRIQESWSERERESREVQSAGPWRAPSLEWIGER